MSITTMVIVVMDIYLQIVHHNSVTRMMDISYEKVLLSEIEPVLETLSGLKTSFVNKLKFILFDEVGQVGASLLRRVLLGLCFPVLTKLISHRWFYPAALTVQRDI